MFLTESAARDILDNSAMLFDWRVEAFEYNRLETVVEVKWKFIYEPSDGSLPPGTTVQTYPVMQISERSTDEEEEFTQGILGVVGAMFTRIYTATAEHKQQ